ncbi:MAG: parallel beta-helix domain-containing protein [Bermanella sp.]
MNTIKKIKLATAIAAGMTLIGCGSSSDSDAVTTASGYEIPSDAIYVSADAADGTDITEAFVEAVTDVATDAVIVLPKGNFTISATVNVVAANGITITGHGIDATKLDFSTSAGNDGIFFDGGNNLTIRDLGVYEVPKNGIKADAVNGIHFAYTAAVWETPLDAGGEDNGAYGLYPVSSENVLMEYNYSKGSADAGIYVGQSNNIVVRHNVAEHNVAGIEIENSTMADVYNNEAFDNSAGILSFDLPGLPQASGANVRIFNNTTYANNTANVGSGTVGAVPGGTGILILATSDVEIYNNNIRDNKSNGVTITSFFLMDAELDDRDYADTIGKGWTPTVKNINIHDNTFENNSSEPLTGTLFDEVFGGYAAYYQSVPAVIYDGVGELLANAGGLAAIGIPAYTDAEKSCASNNTNANTNDLAFTIGSIFGVDPTDTDPSNFDADSNPVETLRFSAMGDEATILNCATAPTRLTAATVTFKGDKYGCLGDDAELAACAL